RWHVGARAEADHDNRAQRPVSLQPQPDLSVVHLAADWIVDLIEQSLAARDSRSPGCLHRGGGDPPRRTLPRREVSGLCELPGRCPALDVVKFERLVVTLHFRVLRVDAAGGGRKFSRIQTSLLSASIVENTMRVPSGCTAGELIRALI